MSDGYTGCMPGRMCLACRFKDCIRKEARKYYSEENKMLAVEPSRRRKPMPRLMEKHRICARKENHMEQGTRLRVSSMEKGLLESMLLAKYGDKLEPVKRPLRHPPRWKGTKNNRREAKA